MTLYEQTLEYKNAIENAVLGYDPETGEIFDDETIEALGLAYEEKIENCLVFYKNMVAEATAIKNEEDNLKARRESLETRAENFLNYIVSCVQNAGDEKFETAKGRLSSRKSKKTVLDDETAIPAAFYEVVSEKKFNKNAIKKAIESGETVPGARVVENINWSVK